MFCFAHCENYINMKELWLVLILCFVADTLSADNINITMELYVDAVLSNVHPNLTEDIMSMFSKFNFRILESVDKHPNHHLDDTVYGLMAFTNCPNFINLNHHIEDGYYSINHSIVVSLESCPRKNFVGQLQYVYNVDNAIQVFSDLIRIDQTFKVWRAVNLIFDDTLESVINEVLLSSQLSDGHFKFRTLCNLYKIPQVSPVPLDEPYRILDDEVNSNNFVLLLDYGSAKSAMNQILKSRRDIDNFEFFSLKSYWIVVITKPLTSHEDMTSLFDSNLTNIAVIVPSVTQDSEAILQRNSVECLLVAMEKSLLRASNSSELEKNVWASQSCFDFVPPRIVYSSISVSGGSTIEETKWTPGYGFNRSVEGIFMNDGLMKTVVIKGFIDHNPPWQIINGKCNQTTIKSAKGISIQIIRELQRRLSFKLNMFCLNQIVKPDKLSNSSSHWTIVSSVLREKTMDMYIGPLVIKPDRGLEVDFMIPFQSEPYVIVNGKPKETSPVLLLINTFDFEVWIGLLIVASLLILSIAVTRLLIPSNYFKTWKLSRLNLSESYLTTIGILLQQGVHLITNSPANRILLLTWILASIVICSTYNGSLFSFMTIPRFEPTPSTLNELFSEAGLTWGIDRNTLANSRILDSNNTKFKRLRDNAILHDDITSDVLSEVKFQRHVLIEGETKAKQIINKEFIKKGFRNVKSFVLGEPFFYDQMSFALYKNHPLTEILNNALQSILSEGIIDKWKREFGPEHSFNKHTVITPTMKERAVKFRFDKFQGGVILLAMGCVVAVFSLMSECIVKRICFKE